MKKLLLFFMSIFSVLSYGQFPEGFEGATFPPTGWIRFDNGIGLAQQWNETSTTALVFAGSKAAYLNKENVVTGTAQDWLVTPQVLVPTNGQLRFYTKLTQAGDQGSIYTIRVSTTSQNNPSDFTTIRTWTEPQIMDDDDVGDSGSTLAQQSTYIQKSVNLSAYAGQNIYIAFVMSNDDGDRWCVDNVNVDQQCLVNTALLATPLATSASLSWTSSSTGPWEIEYGPVGFTQGAGTIVSASTNVNFNLSPLLPLTQYTYYVRSLCASDNISPWSTGLDFTTSALPPGCGGNFVDTGGATANYPNNQDYVITICPDNPGDYVTVTFTSFFTEASYDKLYVYDGNSTAAPQISSGNGGGFGPVTLPGGFWGNLNANLPGPFEGTSASGCITFRFVSDGIINNPGWTANIVCQPIPSCPKPTNITANAISSSSIVVNWTNNAPLATQWEVIWVPAGSPAPLPTDTGTLTTDPSTYTITGLTSSTAYDVYVRAICATGTDVGPWSTVHGTATTNPDYCAGDHFYDLGGATGNYPNNANSVITICPENTGDVVTVYFNSFDLISSIGDALTIYDGNDTTGAVVGTYFGTNVIPSYTSTSPSGCLTFSFVSNGSQNAPGWDATIVCGPPCPSITSVLDSTVPAAGAENIIRICPGTSVDFIGSGVFADPTGASGATYEWNFDDGSSATGTNVTHVFTNEGIYLVNLTITDANGCRNNNLINQKIYVSTTPVFTGSAAFDDEICLGQSTTITGVSTPVSFVRECAPPVSGTTFLPDGSGVSYQTTVPVDCFPFGSSITAASQITSVCIDMEHSYLGDLEIRLVSPNGQSIILKAFNGVGGGGGGTYLGCPLDDPAVGPGTGRTYCFTPTATTFLVNGTTSTCGTPVNASINAGNYMPVQPFTNLIGSSLNGNWSLIVTDNLGIDNGYIFSWGINFDSSILPTDYAFTPVINSSNWTPDSSIVSTNGNTITVTPTVVGTNCYTYNVTDNFGCTYSQQVCIEVLPGVSLTNLTPSAPVCVGENGSFTLNGSPNTTVTYNIDGGGAQTVLLDASGSATVSFTGLTASTTLNATYITAPAIPTTGNVISAVGGVNPNNSIGAIAALGTTATTANSTTINALNPLVSLTLANELPPGTTIIVSIARNNNAGSVTISDGVNSQIFNAGPNNILQYISFTTGTFTDVITITRNNGNTYVDGISYSYDELGCDSPLTFSETIIVNPIPSVNSIVNPNILCSGDNAIFTIQGTPNTNVTYSINGGTNQVVLMNNVGQGIISIPNVTSNVTLSITQAQIGSCISALSLTENIIVNALPSVTSLTTNSPICQTEDAIFTITGTPNATVTYSVNGAANSTIVIGASGTAVVTIANASSNTTIILSNINEGICNVLLTNTSTVVVNPSPNIPTLTAIAESVCIGEDVVFNVSGSANATISYTINGGANQTLVLDGAGNGVITVLAATITTLVELQDVMEGFCTLTLTVSEDVIVETCTIQKGISPNNDGRNDSFDLSGYNVSKLEIFNRYGTIVYSKNNYEDEWFGQSDNGNELPDGTYYYVIKFTDIETKTGWIYINREQ